MKLTQYAEIKPGLKAIQHAFIRLHPARKACFHERGYEYILRTTNQLRGGDKLSNIKLLYRYAQLPLDSIVLNRQRNHIPHSLNSPWSILLPSLLNTALTSLDLSGAVKHIWSLRHGHRRYHTQAEAHNGRLAPLLARVKMGGYPLMRYTKGNLEAENTTAISPEHKARKKSD